MQRKIFTFFAAICAAWFFTVATYAQTTVSVYATGTTGSYHTGSVNVNGVKYDGNIDSVSFGAAAPYFPTIRGWAEFDLSSLPVGATISSVTLYFTTYNGTTSSGASNPITGFLGDASTMTGTNLYNAILNGTSLAATIWTANGLQTASLGTAGNSFVQNNIGSTVNIGFQRAGYLPYFIYGYPAATANQPRLDITFSVTTPCSGITSVAASGPSTTCAGNPITISSATLPYATGYTFQWESSPGGANTWTPMAGETNSSLVTTQTAATDYRVVVTCPAASTTDTSNVVAVAQTNFNNCYCPGTVSYVANEDITNVTLGTINNTSSCGSLTGSQGTATGGADIYSNYTVSTVPVPTLMLGTSQTLSVTLNTCSGTSNIRECKAYIDYDQNGLFTDPGEEIIVYAASNPNTTSYIASTTFSVPVTAVLGNTRMRVILAQGTGAILNPCQVLNSYGEIEDYTINIAALVNCTGTPTAGVVSGQGTVCGNTNFSLTAGGASTNNGVVYQWQSSPSATPGTWTDISGATSLNLSATQTSPTYYRMYASCTANSLGDTTAAHFVDASPFYTCYCVSGPTTDFYSDITNVTVGSFTNTSACNSLAPGAGSVQNRYSNYTSGTGAPTAPQIAHTFPISFSIDITECNSFGAYSGTAIFIDYDQSGTFDAGEMVYGNTAYVMGNHNVTGSFTLPSSASIGLTGMRIVNQYYINGNAATPCNNTVYAGETEDYLIDIIPPPNCSGTPTAGTVSATTNAVCLSSLDTVRLATIGTTIAGGLFYQWQESPTGTPGTWTDIPGANNLNYNAPQLSATYYRMYVICQFSSGANTDTTNAVFVDMLPFYACYCSPRLGTTLHTCCGNYISNVTVTNTMLNNTTTTYGNGYYTFYDTTVASQKADMAQGVSYTIDVTCPYTGYGADVWIDWDQSGTFDAGEHIPTTTTGSIATATILVPLTASMGYTGMRVRNNWGSSYGAAGACSGSGGYETEDYVVNILPAPSCIPPSSLSATNPTSSSIDIAWAVNSFASLWQIEYGPTPYTQGTGTILTTATNPEILTGLQPATEYAYYVRDICGPNDTSTWSYGGKFSTACLAFNTPFAESFNGTATPACWTNSSAVPYGWMFGTGYSSPGYDVSSAADHTGTAGSTFAWVDGSYVTTNQTATLISPVIDISTLTIPQLRYYIISYGPQTTGNNKLVVDAYDFNIMDWVQVDSVQQNFSSAAWQERNASMFGIISSTTTQLRFRYTGLAATPFYNDILIDDIHIEQTPTCPAPNVSVNSNTITTTDADVSWVSSSSASGLAEIEWGLGTSFAIGTGNRISGITATNPYTITNLTPGTQYSVFVRDICAPGDTSAWSSRISFFTLPANDFCSGSITVWSGSVTGNNAAATDDPLASLPVCTGSSTSGYYKGLWYDFTPTTSGNVTVATCGAPFDTYLRIFDGICGSLSNCIAFNDDGCSPASTVTFSATANTTYYVLVAGFGSASFGTFTLTVTGQPLAIRLGNFTAANMGKVNKVEWNTLSEEHGDKFELERSADGKYFAAIHQKQANGEASHYTYIDNNPVKGMNYYRLRMTAANGNVSYSEVVNAFVKSSGFEVNAYPNPVTDDLTVKISGMQGANASIQITDVTGKLIESIIMTGTTETISMSRLAKGIYLLKYSDANHTQTIRVNKQ